MYISHPRARLLLFRSYLKCEILAVLLKERSHSPTHSLFVSIVVQQKDCGSDRYRAAVFPHMKFPYLSNLLHASYLMMHNRLQLDFILSTK